MVLSISSFDIFLFSEQVIGDRFMRAGVLVSLPGEYSRFGRIQDSYGVAYSVPAEEIPQGVKEGDKLAYKVEIWGNDSGLAYNLKK